MAVDRNMGNFVAIKQIDLKKKISKAQLSSLMVEHTISTSQHLKTLTLDTTFQTNSKQK
jgi:hypothetical protein